jgi:hypothetical protein
MSLARRRSAAEQASEAMDARGREVATLFRMGELLQSSLSPEDIRRVVSHTARELLPELGGAFYVFNNSRDRLDLLGAWGAGEAAEATHHFGAEAAFHQRLDAFNEVVAGVDIDRRALELGGGHLASDGTLPDQLIEPGLLPLELAGE